MINWILSYRIVNGRVYRLNLVFERICFLFLVASNNIFSITLIIQTKFSEKKFPRDITSIQLTYKVLKRFQFLY